MSKSVYHVIMKKGSIVLVLCLCLSGCGWTPPNPQLSDTVTTLPVIKPEIKKVVKQESNEAWPCLYDEKDVIGRIYFKFDSAVLSGVDQRYLERKIVPLLKANPKQRLLLAGYADWIGQEGYNKELGLRRAQSVAEFLIQSGISLDRFEVITLGNREATQGLRKADAVKDRRCDMVKIP